MKTKTWLKQVADIKPSELPPFDDMPNPDCYYSKFDGSYITQVGMEDNIKYLAERGITDELTHGVGFSPKDNKWYGWSRRAIYGFEIGSTCVKGDCHFVADNPEEMIDDYANFFADIDQKIADKHRAECSILPDRSGILINHEGHVLPVAMDMEEAFKSIKSGIELPKERILIGTSIQKCGRGTWTAKTMEDAKQMAIDFNEGVS